MTTAEPATVTARRSENLVRRALNGPDAQSIESRILLVTAAAIIYLGTHGLKRAAKRLGPSEP